MGVPGIRRYHMQIDTMQALTLFSFLSGQGKSLGMRLHALIPKCFYILLAYIYIYIVEPLCCRHHGTYCYVFGL